MLFTNLGETLDSVPSGIVLVPTYYICGIMQFMYVSAISFPGNQATTLKLVNTMSSGVPGPSLGHLFPQLEYWGPF